MLTTPSRLNRSPTFWSHRVPGCRRRGPRFAEENADPARPGGRLGYLDGGWIVARLADRFASGNTDGFDEFFELVERLVVDGDDYVRNLGVIGYLEGMQMQTVTSRGVDPEAFRPWLRPLSLKYWAAINDFWEAGIPIPDLQPD
jgi:hypothetical protein